jgi:ATP-binding cassette subfamily B protein
VSRIRVYELARAAGLSNDDVRARLARLGVPVSSSSATVSGAQAERFWAALAAERNGGATKVRVHELARRMRMDTREVLARLRALDVPASSHASTVFSFDADRLLAALGVSGNGHHAAGHDQTQAAHAPAEPEPQAEPERPWLPPLGRPRRLVPRVLREVTPYSRGIAAIVALDLLATPLLLLSPVPLKIAVDSVLGDRPLPGFLQPFVPDALTRTDLRLLVVVAALQVLIVLGAQLQSLGSYVLHTSVGERLTLGFRARLFRHAQHLSLAYHDQRGPSDALYRIEYDAPSLQYIVDSAIPLVTSAVMFAATLYVTARIDWPLAVVALAVSPVLFVLSRGYSARMRGQYRRLKELEASELKVVQEVLSAVRVVKAFGREAAEQDRFVERSTAAVRGRVGLSFAEGAFGLGINLTTAAGAAVVLFLGVRNVAGGSLTLGELLIVIGYLAQLYGPLQEVSQKAGDIQGSLAGAERAFELLDEHPEVVERADARPLARAEGGLEFRGVAFSYDGATDVLRDVSVRIEPGAIVGIVGRTGAGKTTLVSLITRFYDPARGAILLDGVDLRDYRLADLRSQFALVLQEPVLFSTSIAENLRYARPDASRSQIVAAAQAAGAHDFIAALPDGYDTLVGERGMRLSGGERQRISLARAFLKDAPILLLDEPTSSVDVETEAQIVAAMRRLMAGRTTLMIAHRLSTLDDCDALLEVADGRVRLVDGEHVAAVAARAELSA